MEGEAAQRDPASLILGVTCWKKGEERREKRKKSRAKRSFGERDDAISGSRSANEEAEARVLARLSFHDTVHRL